MKKIFTIVATVTLSLAATAQTMNVHFKNGTKVQFDKTNVDYVDFTEKPDDPTLTSGDYVDLGLSVKWASCNLGATKPTERGGYYAWGETSPRSSFNKSNYAHYNSSTATYTDIGSDISGTQYDAATVNLGKDWRMPTKAELSELKSKCTWTWTQVNSVNGYLVEATNGNSIFIPAAGWKGGLSDGYGESCDYWSSTGSTSSAYRLYNYDGAVNISSITLTYCGYSIRPVYSPASESGISNIEDYVTIARTGQSTTITSSGTAYTVTFSIKNTHNTETIHLVSLGGVSIDTDLTAGKTYTTTLQSSTTYVQNYKLELVFTYNGKSYTIKG